ncbi:aminotransferase class IV [Actinomadura parmotrematis]|uniref:Aminotransferase class IV n=1 Tax=Actinomadura parmotrematis TaxID=2864039 RepID=A0ABS7FKE8_9ACTN|nr:aminotransferase class IV [Actinomadura parmotrematis]MBW8480824.1 aminotransferase class IV [Actinomadura parmotrematis]
MPSRTEIDGRPPDAADLLVPAQVNHGHLTVMQVRGGAARGLGLHLERLDAANRELYGEGLDGGLVRDRIRHALDGAADASVRLVAFRDGDRVRIMVAVSAPRGAVPGPVALRTAAYRRPFPHIKHVGAFGQLRHRELAARDGFDDVLLVDHAGVVAETGIANLLCHDGTGFVWPDAPALAGVTMRALDRAGLGAARRRVHRDDLPGCAAVFVTNSGGVTPVGRLDDLAIPQDGALTRDLLARYEAVPWEAL